MRLTASLHDSIVVSIPACHAGDRGSIPRRGAFFLFFVIIFIRQKISSGMKKVVIWHFYPSDFGNRIINKPSVGPWIPVWAFSSTFDLVHGFGFTQS